MGRVNIGISSAWNLSSPEVLACHEPWWVDIPWWNDWAESLQARFSSLSILVPLGNCRLELWDDRNESVSVRSRVVPILGWRIYSTYIIKVCTYMHME
jgi:hypothetical protein